MTIDQPHWQERLTALADKHGVPGASLAVLAGGEVVEAATGVLNLRTGHPVTTDSLFQIGSITKVWTVTLVMQLVDEGLLDLDEPIVTYLPEFRVADPEVTAEVTARHLMAHTSGIDGDLFLDTGRGDDCVEKYVAACADLRQNHALGATMSYCNSGYTVLGRLVEVLREATWDSVLRKRLLEPLGLATAGTLPEEALLHSAAVGHVTPPGGEIAVAPAWGIFRSAGPAGLIHSTARDQLQFARLHLADGVAPDGTRLLSEASARAMREPQVEVPDPYSIAAHWGLGWILMGWDRGVYGHDGGTIGQAAFLRIVPGADVAVCLLTNGGHFQELYDELFREVLSEIADVAVPRPLQPALEPVEVDLQRYVGRYAREGTEMTIRAEDGRLIANARNTGGLAELEQQEDDPDIEIRPVSKDVFVLRTAPDEAWTPAVFFELDGVLYVHAGVRATPKVG
jgi:CubicO group peptidase (beta-lactamase class C family)